MSLPALDDYRGLMPFIEEWEAGQAEFLGALLLDALRGGCRSVIDLGCGPGTYLLPFIAAGCWGLGVDAEPAAGGQLPEGCFRQLDLRRPLPKLGRFDLALCIEVGEHLQAEFAGPLVANVAACAEVVFWSAAHPGQGGQHHHHEQPPEYWEALFSRHGYVTHPAEAAVRRAIAENAECQKVEWLIPNARLLCGPMTR
jgi:SAM-dependent methyltransferase